MGSVPPVWKRDAEMYIMDHPTQIVNLLISILALVVFTLSYFTTKKQGASHTVVLWTAIGISDTFTDIWLVINLYSASMVFFAIFLTSLILSLAANAIFLYWVFGNEIRRSRSFRKWYTTNFGAFKIIMTLSCFDIQIVRLIDSGIFDVGATGIQLSEGLEHLLNTTTSVSILLENIPQLAIEVLACLLIQKNTAILRENLPIAIALSSFDILSSMVGLLFALGVSVRRTTVAPSFHHRQSDTLMALLEANMLNTTDLLNSGSSSMFSDEKVFTTGAQSTIRSDTGGRV